MEWNVFFFVNSVLLGVGLTMDAFSVSLANGLNEPKMRKKKMCGVAGVYAFFQALMTATEAKTKALQSENIRDERSGTIATGTATDSLLIAATQKGEEMLYGGPVTEVGKMIAKGVYETTVQAIRNYKNQF